MEQNSTVTFSLAFTEPLMGLTPAEQQSRILAANRTIFPQYGLRLAPDEAEMLAATARRAAAEEDLVLIGADITPRLLHWFLPSGYFHSGIALQTADLVEAFYRTKGTLQEIAGEVKAQQFMLSDNAILDLLYRFYICPECAGDTENVMYYMEEIVFPAAARMMRGKQAQAESRLHTAPKTVQSMLYADMQQPEPDSWADTYLEETDREEYEANYRSILHGEVLNDFSTDYYSEAWAATRDSYPAKLAELLAYNPNFLWPSAGMEDEWESMALSWESADEAD